MMSYNSSQQLTKAKKYSTFLIYFVQFPYRIEFVSSLSHWRTQGPGCLFIILKNSAENSIANNLDKNTVGRFGTLYSPNIIVASIQKV